MSDQRNEFQLLVLNMLCVELVPEPLRGRKVDVKFKALLLKSVSLLNQDLCRLGRLTSISTKQEFCWGVLATCCSKIIISKDNLYWVEDYSALIRDVDLGLIFKTCGEKGIIKLPDQIKSTDLDRCVVKSTIHDYAFMYVCN